METVLSIKNLNKKYGKIHAVKNLSFNVEKGNVFGILGPNGSGKTTTLSIILDVINAKSGSYSWFGQYPSKESRKKIGAILEHPIFYPYLTAVKNLEIIADIKGIKYNDIERVLHTVELHDRRNSKFKTFSYGMKQRLAIAAALIGKPEVLIFDEPTNGLDPKGIAEIRELIINIAAKGITIILASHLLDEVQKTCSHVTVLKKGEKLFAGKVNDVLNISDTIEISSNNIDMLKLAVKEYDKVTDIKKELDLLVVNLKEGTTTFDLNNFLVNKGIILSHLTVRKKSLEQQFLGLLTENE
ncbi:MAG: ATP-binding cassette domain-containing protein [Bacteroidetes bacterium]|nr:ATP-binding cassette domain-containing protein [Bacteroidota bacterium]MBL7105030.1 ATP-binding cassette domain-containing protein [Bacteroidales bacterium]